MTDVIKQWKRIVVGIIYFFALSGIFFIFFDNPFQNIFSSDKDMSITYFTGALLLILGKYLIEPFFTKPVDALVNSVSVILALNSISKKADFYFYWTVYYFALLVFTIGLASIFTKEFSNKPIKTISRILYCITVTLGQSKVIFSLVYVSSVYSYFLSDVSTKTITLFSLLLLYWILVVFFDIIILVWNKIESVFIPLLIKNKTPEIGYAIGCENPSLYKIECNAEDYDERSVVENFVLIETINNICQIGIVIEVEHLLGKRWLSVNLLKTENNEYYNFSISKFNVFDIRKTMFDTKKNRAFLSKPEQLSKEKMDDISKNYFFQNKDNFIGYTTTDSDIYTINISILTKNIELLSKITDGSIIKCLINGKEVQYQIINGKTKKEHLENHDSFGYTIAIAKKLGVYENTKNELLQARWMPEIYTPVFIYQQKDISEKSLQEISDKAIGRLPKTDLSIPIKSYDDIVTHNTAILGILGIGKSCLTYELIKKLTKEDVKIVCIDITNEYIKELPCYISSAIIEHDEENAFDQIKTTYENIHLDTIIKNNRPDQVPNPDKSGNRLEYQNAIQKDLYGFFFEGDTIPENKLFAQGKKIRIYNPDYHKVSKGEKVGYNVITTDLTQAEKTRIIVERIFMILMKMGVSSDKKARVLVVFEEAHSLIPEWNSVSNEGDKTAANGTARVILQGRKYGLGCFVITQRTANVSKSILNQCNTIFAMRVFDDTGKGFLENYFGTDYTNTLPTLEERNAIVIGKGLLLKQPVIIELNNKKYTATENCSEE
jgi:hypothetical protein